MFGARTVRAQRWGSQRGLVLTMPHSLKMEMMRRPLHHDPDRLVEIAATHPGIKALGGGLPTLSYIALGGHDPHSELHAAMEDLENLSGAMGYAPTTRSKLAAAAHSSALATKRRGGSFEDFTNGLGSVLGAVSQAAPLVAAMI